MNSSTKTRDRYLTPRITELVAQMDEVRDALQLRRNAWLAELQQRASTLQDEIALIAHAVAQLDCHVRYMVTPTLACGVLSDDARTHTQHGCFC